MMTSRWTMDGVDVLVAHPYVEFKKGLPIELHPLSEDPDFDFLE